MSSLPLPLSFVDKAVAIDSTGFSTLRYSRYESFKDRIGNKLHIGYGTRSQIVMSAETGAAKMEDDTFLLYLLIPIDNSYQIVQSISLIYKVRLLKFAHLILPS